MNRLITTVMLSALLAVASPTLAQSSGSAERKQPPPTKELEALQRQLREANEDYQKSLLELLRLHEQDLSKRRANLEKVRKLAEEGRLEPADVERAEAEVSAAQRRIDEVKLRMKAGDDFVEDALNLRPGRVETRFAAPRQSCKLTVDEAPEVRGLKLRMTTKELAALYQGIDTTGERVGHAVTIRQGNLGQSSVSFSTAIYSIYDKEGANKLDGVERVELHFLDGRISYIRLDYDASVRWSGVGDFTRRIAEALRLPEAWRPAGDESVMECEGFSVTASLEGLAGPYVSFSDQAVSEVVRRRRQEELRKAKEAFKP